MDFTVKRRRFVQAMSSGLMISVAGCFNQSDDDDSANEDGDGQNQEDNGTDETSTETDASTENASGDVAYAFGSNAIAIIDPETGNVVEEITDGIDGYQWGDALPTRDQSHLLAIEETLTQVLIIDTETREIVDDLAIGPDATHLFYATEGEIWAHADAEGTFYAIDTESHEVTETVVTGLENEGHGKLLYHEELGSKGYATNVNDPVAHVIDMESYERTNSIELGEEGGTHYKAYSPHNGLAYFERSGGVGTTPVIDTETDEIVDELEFTGGMYPSPDEKLLGIIDHNEIHFIDTTTKESEVVGSVEIEGGPDALEYHDIDGTRYGFTANTMNSKAVVIDIDALEVVNQIEAGDIERPEDAEHLHRSGVSGGGYFFTPAGAEGTVAVIDMEAQKLIEHVPVEDGLSTVQYVANADSGQ